VGVASPAGSVGSSRVNRALSDRLRPAQRGRPALTTGRIATITTYHQPDASCPAGGGKARRRRQKEVSAESPSAPVGPVAGWVAGPGLCKFSPARSIGSGEVTGLVRPRAGERCSGYTRRGEIG
jgi:hypothetical protein